MQAVFTNSISLHVIFSSIIHFLMIKILLLCIFVAYYDLSVLHMHVIKAILLGMLQLNGASHKLFGGSVIC